MYSKFIVLLVKYSRPIKFFGVLIAPLNSKPTILNRRIKLVYYIKIYKLIFRWKTMQSNSEKIDRLAAKVQGDYRDNASFYNEFISLARSVHGLRREDAEDVWQNVFLRLTTENPQGRYSIETYQYDLDDVPSLKNDRCLSGWLMRCLHNKCIDYKKMKAVRRKAGYDVQIPSSFDEEGNLAMFDVEGHETDPLERLIKTEDETAFDKRLTPLGNYGNLLKLHYVDGMTYEEIASLLEVPVGTVKSRLNAARNKAEKSYESKAA